MSEKPEIYNMPEVSYHEIPKCEDEYVMHKGRAAQCANGSVIEVWSIKECDDLAIFMRRPLEDERQSVLKFRISNQGAWALGGLLSDKLIEMAEGGKEP